MTPFTVRCFGFVLIRYLKEQYDEIVINQRRVYHYSIYQLINTIHRAYSFNQIEVYNGKKLLTHMEVIFLLLQKKVHLDCRFYSRFIVE